MSARAKYRDCIRNVRKLGDKQHIVASPDTECDVVGVYSDDLGGSVTVLFVRGGAITDRETFYFGADEILDGPALVSFLTRFYQLREYIPESILLSYPLEPEEAELLSERLYGKSSRAKVSVPVRGEKKELVRARIRKCKRADTAQDATDAKSSGDCRRAGRSRCNWRFCQSASKPMTSPTAATSTSPAG